MKLANTALRMLALLLFFLGGCAQENPRVATHFNREAALAGDLPFRPLSWKVITSWVNLKDATMSTLYGNDPAVAYARANPSAKYPEGSIIALVTWNQQEDPRWFGARIPAAVKSVEFVSVSQQAGTSAPVYQRFEGNPLKPVSQKDSEALDRAQYLLSQRAAVMP